MPFFSFDSLMKRKQQAYSLNGKTVSISSKKGKNSHNAAATKVRREQVARFKFSEQAVKSGIYYLLANWSLFIQFSIFE